MRTKPFPGQKVKRTGGALHALTEGGSLIADRDRHRIWSVYGRKPASGSGEHAKQFGAPEYFVPFGKA